MQYQVRLVFDDINELAKLKELAQKDKRSKETWALFEKCAKVVPNVPQANGAETALVDFLTVIRSTTSNQILAKPRRYPASCAIVTHCITSDSKASVEDLSLVNAYTALMNNVFIRNPYMQANNMLATGSTPLMCGVVWANGVFYVYQNVILSDNIFDGFTSGDAETSEEYVVWDLQEYKEAPQDVLSDLIFDTLTIVEKKEEENGR